MEPTALPPDQPRSWLSVWLGRGLLFFTLALTWLTCLFVFRVLNRTTVIGRHYLGPRRRCLIVSNHQSLIDSFLVGLVAYFPWVLWHLDLAPSHLADANNFVTHPLLKFVYRELRVIPVGRNADGTRSDLKAFLAARRVLASGRILHVFPEGTRSTSEQLLPPVPQVGALALVDGVTVLPVYISGMHKVFPYRKKRGDPPATLWRFLFGRQTEWLLDVRAGHRLTVVVGRPISPDELRRIAGQGRPREQSARVSEALMCRIRHLQFVCDQTQASAR